MPETGTLQSSNGGENHHRKLATPLQHRAPALIVGVQTASARGHPPGQSGLRYVEAPSGSAFPQRQSHGYIKCGCVIGVSSNRSANIAFGDSCRKWRFHLPTETIFHRFWRICGAKSAKSGAVTERPDKSSNGDDRVVDHGRTRNILESFSYSGLLN